MPGVCRISQECREDREDREGREDRSSQKVREQGRVFEAFVQEGLHGQEEEDHPGVEQDQLQPQVCSLFTSSSL